MYRQRRHRVPDELGGRPGQHHSQAVAHHLPQPDRAAVVPQRVPAGLRQRQVGHRAGAGRIVERLDHRVGDHHLAGVGGAHDPGAVVDGEAERLALDLVDVAGVHPHPHPDRQALGPRLGGQRPLGLDRGRQRTGRPVEGRQRPVARVAHEAAAPPRHRPGDESPVPDQQVGVAGPGLGDQARRGHDVALHHRDVARPPADPPSRSGHDTTLGQGARTSLANPLWPATPGRDRRHRPDTPPGQPQE